MIEWVPINIEKPKDYAYVAVFFGATHPDAYRVPLGMYSWNPQRGFTDYGGDALENQPTHWARAINFPEAGEYSKELRAWTYKDGGIGYQAAVGEFD